MPFGAPSAVTWSMPWWTIASTSILAVTDGVTTWPGPAGVVTR